MNDDNALSTRISVRDLNPGDAVLQFFELRALQIRKTRSGDNYLDLTLGDATGSIVGKMWPDAIRRWGTDFNPGDLVKVEGRVDTFRETNQLVVEKMRSASPSEVPDIKELLQTTAYDPDAVLDELRNTAAGLNPPELGELVGEILDRYAEDLKTYPAARMVHHAYRGGLIEHILTVTRKVEAVVATDPTVNRNMAVAGAILHDIGKLMELDPARRGRTLEGRLVGHLILGVEMVREVALQKKIADRKWLRDLEHILISHHGETEFGSPVRPLTREALVVHFLDNLDSRLKIVEEALQSQEPGGFSTYNRWLEGRAFAGSLSVPQEEEDDAGA
jgi:3'-5' exoribonuclease